MWNRLKLVSFKLSQFQGASSDRVGSTGEKNGDLFGNRPNLRSPIVHCCLDWDSTKSFERIIGVPQQTPTLGNKRTSFTRDTN